MHLFFSHGGQVTDGSQDESFRDLFDAVAEDAQILVSALVLSYRNKRLFSSTRPDALGLWGEVEFGVFTTFYPYVYEPFIPPLHSWLSPKNLRLPPTTSS